MRNHTVKLTFERFRRLNINLRGRPDIVNVENYQKSQVKAQYTIDWKWQNKPLFVHLFELEIWFIKMLFHISKIVRKDFDLYMKALNSKIDCRGQNSNKVDEKSEFCSELMSTYFTAWQSGHQWNWYNFSKGRLFSISKIRSKLKSHLFLAN